MVAPDLIIATGDGCVSHYEAVSEAAYYLAQARGFEPGHELDDWLLAERQLGLHCEE